MYQVLQVFNTDLGYMVWSLSRIDGGLLNPDGALAYNFETKAAAIAALQKLTGSRIDSLNEALIDALEMENATGEDEGANDIEDEIASLKLNQGDEK